MPFTRARHDGSKQPTSPQISFPVRSKFRPSLIVRCAAMFMAPVLLAPGMVKAASAKETASGTHGWSTGSMTYIRIRPDVTTPPVAKVPEHTLLYVWGKKDGWYRVETKDGQLGWVFFDYVKTPSPHKVKELSDRRAVLASARTGHQTMYGSPELLKKYVAKFPNDKGAVKALAMQGIYVAPKPKIVIAKAKPAKPVMMAKAVVAPKAEAPSLAVPASKVKPAPRVEIASMPLAPVAPVSKSLMEKEPAVEPVKPAAPVDVTPPAGSNPAESGTAPATMATPAEPLTPVANIAPLNPISKPVAVPAPAAAKTSKDLKRQQLREKFALASRSKTTPLVKSPVSAADVMKARSDYLANRNSRFGGEMPQMPAQPSTNLAPAPPALVQPSSLRDDSKKERALGGPVIVAHSLITPRYEARTDLRDSQMQLRMDETAKPDVAVATANEAQVEVAPAKVSQDNIAPAAKAEAKAAVSTVKATAAKSPVHQSFMAYRGGSPSDRAGVTYRGGSPRDHFAGEFGKGVANKALSYRGMPYHRGASSPTYGFDCSGLVYYVLRQRGLNPPRTAAGYRNYGVAVPSGQWKEGDLVLFANTYKRGISHIGVYIGNGKFVHAATSGEGVRVDSLSDAYYSRKYYGARRVP